MKEKIVGVIMFILFLAAGGAGGYALAAWADRLELDAGEFVFYAAFLLVSIYIAYFIQTILHEGGHLIFGLLSGYTFCSFRIGSFLWMREDGRIVRKRYALAGTGGQCLMAPPDMQDGKVPYVLYNLGGVLVNLITGAFFLAAALLLSGAVLPQIFFGCLAVLGFLAALTNGIPMKAALINNDGQNIVDIGKSREAMNSFWVMMKIGELQTKGMMLREMPEEWFRVPDENETGNPITVSRAIFVENRLVEERRFEEASRLCDRLLSMESAAIIGVYRTVLVCDRIYFELIGTQDEAVLSQWTEKRHQKMLRQMKNNLTVLRTEYAWTLLYRGGNGAGKEAETGKGTEQALKLRTRFEKCAASYPYPADAANERALMELAEKRCEERKTKGEISGGELSGNQEVSA